MTYAYTPQIWPPVLTVLLLVALAVYSDRRRSVPGALPFTFALLFSALWTAGSALEHAALDLPAKIAWVQFQAAWQLPSAIAITSFLLEYVWPGRWLTRRNLALLSIFPLLIALFILTNDRHHLVWSSFAFNGTVTPLLGPVGWLGIILGFSLLIVNFTVLAWLFLHSPQHRWFVVLIIGAQLIFRTLYILDITQAIQLDLPLDVLGIAFAYLLYTFALFRFHVLNPVPLARQAVIDQMREGMLVVDLHGRVVSLNPSALVLLGISEAQACGRPVQDLLPPGTYPQDGSLSEAEISLGTGPAARAYQLAISLLKDWRGQEAGRLLLLLDVTEQRRSQDQILEQQRALATLQERYRLARELHDELAQGLALINVQAQLVSGLLETGQNEQAQAHLQALAKAARAAQVDVRGEIGKLSHRLDPVEGFQGSLRQLTEAFQETCEVEIELTQPGDPCAVSLAPTAEVQLLRIVQEAFANIRKHARAKRVRVSLTKEVDCMLLQIEDDGVGFNPDELPTSRQAFGLGMMSQRAAQVGGRAAVKSTPGRGTEVIIEVPVNGEII